MSDAVTRPVLVSTEYDPLPDCFLTSTLKGEFASVLIDVSICDSIFDVAASTAASVYVFSTVNRSGGVGSSTFDFHEPPFATEVSGNAGMTWTSRFLRPVSERTLPP